MRDGDGKQAGPSEFNFVCQPSFPSKEIWEAFS